MLISNDNDDNNDNNKRPNSSTVLTTEILETLDVSNCPL
jgi:hypothetical protein